MKNEGDVEATIMRLTRGHPIRITFDKDLAGVGGKEACVICGLIDPDIDKEERQDYPDALLEAVDHCVAPSIEAPGLRIEDGVYDYDPRRDDNSALYGRYLCEADRGTIFEQPYELLLEARKELLEG